MYSKQSQAGRYSKKKGKKLNVPESSLQSFTDDFLAFKPNIKGKHIPDALWGSMAVLKRNLAYHVTKYPQLLGVFNQYKGIYEVVKSILAGVPDNPMHIKVSDSYMLTGNLELKTKSNLHGVQKPNSTDYAWQIARTPEEVQDIIKQFEKDADRVSELLKGDG